MERVFFFLLSSDDMTCTGSADDMLAILFPHLFEDIEYLVPAEGEEVEMYSLSGDFEHEDSGVQEQETPIAGPSRLGR